MNIGKTLSKEQMKKISGGAPITVPITRCACSGVSGAFWCPLSDICDCVGSNCGSTNNYVCAS